MARFASLAAAAAVLTLALSPAAFAQSQGGQQPACKPGEQHCVQPQGQAAGNAAKQQGHKDQAKPQAKGQKQGSAHAAPHVGDSAKAGRQVQPPAHGQLKAPPKGQEYRVIDDQVVRVDSSTLKILAVVGLASALLN
ncbi:hypothetical protein [Mangrovicoccus sp. HB161399]|uniref:hypothetical protein n=1 Tax=Mangrovicoccus sp. HB161399 TaxID=2720392 RepID=UPI0015563877|nr:hypothetical protein [Mangrovicoccus sp. HB161399]